MADIDFIREDFSVPVMVDMRAGALCAYPFGNGLGASGSEAHCPLACPARNRGRRTNKNYNRIRKPAA
jgi:hypothetical protein